MNCFKPAIVVLMHLKSLQLAANSSQLPSQYNNLTFIVPGTSFKR